MAGPAQWSPKGWCQGLLRRLGIYERVRTSLAYDLYWSLADRRIVESRRRELDFYRRLLVGFREGDLVFDVGANQGSKTEVFLRLGARVVAIEPDRLCQRVLREKFLTHRLRPKPVTVVGKALGGSNSIERMWVEAPGSTQNTLSQKWAETLIGDEARLHQRHEFGRSESVETITLEQVMSSHGLPLFVKVDVEGYELEVLRGMRRAVPYLSFEVNLPEFRSEGVECVRVLAGLAEGRFNYSPDCRRGLVLRKWLRSADFLPVLERCADPSIEVFWSARCVG